MQSHCPAGGHSYREVGLVRVGRACMGPAWRHLRELAPNGEGRSYFSLAGSCVEGYVGGWRESGSAPEKKQPLGKRGTCLKPLFAVPFSALL